MNPALDLRASYTYTRATNEDTGQDLTRRPRNMVRLGADWQPRGGTVLSVRARAQSSELVDSTANGRSPAWSTLDLRINHKIARQTTLFGGIDNLFDRQRNFATGTDFGPISGRLVYVGIRHDFGNQ